MNAASEIMTTLFGVVLMAAIGYELRRRRKKLRELYNVLDSEDKHLVADLDLMVTLGTLKPYDASRGL